MSRRQLVDAYVGGRISRRVFIKKLVKAGVTVGAAVTFASVLTPAAAQHPHPDHYHHYDHHTPPTDPHHPPTDPHHPPPDPHHPPHTGPADPAHTAASAQKAVERLLGRIIK
jgi:hypothetical protein